MKLTDDHQRKVVWDALYRADGDRPRAASDLGVSLRTLARWMSNLDLLEQCDKMGWTKNAGPPRAMPRGTSVVRRRFLACLAARGGRARVEELVTDVYGEDSLRARKDLYAAIEDLEQQHVIRPSSDGGWNTV